MPIPTKKMIIQDTDEINIFDYIEPMYPFTKTERFDEENMKPILSDENFNKKDRERLSNYNKHRLSGGVINVSYGLANGCEEHKVGRLFPQDGMGMQSFRFDIRNPLAKRFYWDIYMDNAHYRIAYKYTEKYGLKNDKIKEYMDNRDQWLNHQFKS